MSREITVSAVEVDRSIKREVTSEWSLWIDDDDNERGLSNVCERSLTASLDAISTLFGDELCSGIAKSLTSSLTSSKSHLLLTFEFRSVVTDEPSSLLISCLCPREIKGLERRCPFWVAPRPFLSPLLVWPYFSSSLEGPEFFLSEVVSPTARCCPLLPTYGSSGRTGQSSNSARSAREPCDADGAFGVLAGVAVWETCAWKLEIKLRTSCSNVFRSSVTSSFFFDEASLVYGCKYEFKWLKKLSYFNLTSQVSQQTNYKVKNFRLTSREGPLCISCPFSNSATSDWEPWESGRGVGKGWGIPVFWVKRTLV